MITEFAEIFLVIKPSDIKTICNPTVVFRLLKSAGDNEQKILAVPLLKNKEYLGSNSYSLYDPRSLYNPQILWNYQ